MPLRNGTRQMLSHMRKQVNDWHGARDAFRKLYLEDPHGCVPKEFSGEELLYAIKGKFYWPFDAGARPARDGIRLR